MKRFFIFIFLILFSRSVFAATITTGDVYVLNAASGGAANSADADINDVAINIDSIANMAAYVAAVDAAKGSVNIVDAQPSAQTVDVTLDISQTTAIDAWYFGFNINVNPGLKRTDTDFLHLDATDQPKWEDLMQLLPRGLWRFPGSALDTYWYEQGDASYPCVPDTVTGCKEMAPAGSWANKDRCTESDLQAVYNTCVAANCTMYPRIGGENLSSLQAQSTDMIKWINDEGLSISYFDLGNEPFYSGQDWFQDGSGFADEYDSWHDDFIAEKAGIKFGAPHAIRAQIHYWSGGSVEDFFDRLHSTHSTTLGNTDILAGHFYQRTGSTDDYADLFGWSATESDYNYRLHFKFIADKLTAIKNNYASLSDAKLVMGEFGACTKTSGQGNDLTIYKSIATAVWAADVLGRGARAGLSAMLHDNMAFPDGSGWPSGLFENDLSVESPILYTYLMYGQWWPRAENTALWVTSVTSDDEGNVSVNAARGEDNKTYVMLMNATTGTDKTVRVTINNEPNHTTLYFTCTVPAHSVYNVIFSDVTSPTISGAGPSGILACVEQNGNKTMYWETDEICNCRIDTSDLGDYDNATADSVMNTDSTSHSDTESLACNASYNRYVYCEDPAGNEVGATHISFSIASGSPPDPPAGTVGTISGGGCSGGSM